MCVLCTANLTILNRIVGGLAAVGESGIRAIRIDFDMMFVRQCVNICIPCASSVEICIIIQVFEVETDMRRVYSNVWCLFVVLNFCCKKIIFFLKDLFSNISSSHH